VELLGRYSNRASWAKRLQHLPRATAERATDTVRVRRRTATRLPASQVAALVDGYRAGETVYQLAARFGIHRATVSAHLHCQGIPLRRQGLNTEGVTHAVRLYENGWSLARIGHRLGVDATTAWTAIKAQGTRMRDTHGREQ
jgi:lambda repressor-like predicted transcriptional regulator